MAVEDRLVWSDAELLLPWYATGTLSKRDASNVERDLAACPGLARRFRQVQLERIDIAQATDSAGSPSERPLARVLAAVSHRAASNRRMVRARATGVNAAADSSSGSTEDVMSDSPFSIA